MVLFVMICRSSDGLPLLASTDVDQRVDYLRESQRYVKLLSKKVVQFPDRCVVQAESYSIYFITALDVCYIAVCDGNYPAVLSFCFLEEIQKEFIVEYDVGKVESASRPYSFIDFDMQLRKTKQRYNNPRSLTTKLNLSDMSQELRLRRPFEISPCDLEPSMNGSFGATTSSRFRPAEVPGKSSGPLRWPGLVSVAMNIVCIIINIVEGLSAINVDHIEDDVPNFSVIYYHAGAYAITCFLLMYQVYLLRYTSRWKKSKTYSTLFMLCCLNVYTRGFKNMFQLLIHIAVAVFATFSILSKTMCYKLTDYDV